MIKRRECIIISCFIKRRSDDRNTDTGAADNQVYIETEGYGNIQDTIH